MFSLKVIQHADISKDELDEIIQIKSVAWPYPYEKQQEWINQHLKNSDLHLILKNNKAVAYLNLVDIEIEIDHKLFNAFGVGNVCAIEKGKGFGNELMILTNQYIKTKQKPAMLFCRPELICFYEKFGWLTIEKDKIKLAFKNRNIVTMGFNIKSNLQLIKFFGKTF